MINSYLDSVVSEDRQPRVSVIDLIERGEGPLIEFKTTARFNIRSGGVDKALEAVVVKTVAGFLNADGGTLLIGVSDDGTIVGVDRDIATLNTKSSFDGFELFLRNLLNAGIGTDLCLRVHINFNEIDGKAVCSLQVPVSPRPVWLANGSQKDFFVRNGNSTQPLDGQAAHDYVTAHFRRA